jgi:hypothetical protein
VARLRLGYPSIAPTIAATGVLAHFATLSQGGLLSHPQADVRDLESLHLERWVQSVQYDPGARIEAEIVQSFAAAMLEQAEALPADIEALLDAHWLHLL